MNYYNPYLYTMPTTLASSAPKVGLLSRIFGRSGATLSSILTGTQKVLNVANQAIPLVKQARPMITNAKTMFKIMNEFKRSDTKQRNNNNYQQQANNKSINNNIETSQKETKTTYEQTNIGPTFFA